MFAIEVEYACLMKLEEFSKKKIKGFEFYFLRVLRNFEF